MAAPTEASTENERVLFYGDSRSLALRLREADGEGSVLLQPRRNHAKKASSGRTSQIGTHVETAADALIP